MGRYVESLCSSIFKGLETCFQSFSSVHGYCSNMAAQDSALQGGEPFSSHFRYAPFRIEVDYTLTLT